MFDIQNNTEFLTALGINDADEEVKNTLIIGIEEIAKQRLTERLSERLTEEEAEEFSKIADEKEAHDWLLEHVPDFENMVTEILSDIRYEILKQKAEVVG